MRRARSNDRPNRRHKSSFLQNSPGETPASASCRKHESLDSFRTPRSLLFTILGIEEATSTPYLVMEYLEGQALDRILDKGSVPFPRACALVAEVAVALHTAHRKGVIHGDVKPANILITDENRVKLMDFGMARWPPRHRRQPLARHTCLLVPGNKFWAKRRTVDPTFSRWRNSLLKWSQETGRSTPIRCKELRTRAFLQRRYLRPMQIPRCRKALDEVIGMCLQKEPSARIASAESRLTLSTLWRVANLPLQVTPQPVGLRHRAVHRLLRSA